MIDIAQSTEENNNNMKKRSTKNIKKRKPKENRKKFKFTLNIKTINDGYSLIKCDMKNPCQRKIKSVLETNRQFVFLT